MKSYHLNWHIFKYQTLIKYKILLTLTQIFFMQKIREIIHKLEGIDPYDLLQSKPTEDFTTLKKNYRTLALKYHPDRNKQQTAKQKFIKINLAYEFLQQEENRQIYQNNIKALQEQKLRQQKMSDDRRKMLDQLKKREEQYSRRKKDMDEQLRRKKQFFEKKMQEQEQRQNLRQEILNQMKPNQYYQQLTSIKVQWHKGLSFSKYLLQKAFSEYGKVSNIRIEPKSRQAVLSFSSIDVCAQVVKKFENPQIKIDFLVEKQRRQYLLKALKKQNMGKQIDFSLTTQNLSRLKQVLNRNSSLYLDPTRMNYQ